MKCLRGNGEGKSMLVLKIISKRVHMVLFV